MRDQLTQYVNLIFAGNDDAEEIRQEILQNTLDRYDDLIDQGKSQEAAYRLAIAGIGDIRDILGNEPSGKADYSGYTQPVYDEQTTLEQMGLNLHRLMKAIAIGLYIISPIPLIALDALGLDIVGLCMTLIIIAAATVLLMVFRKPHAEKTASKRERSPKQKDALKETLDSLTSTGGLVLYFVISFATHAWAITWLIFPIMGCIREIINACFDLKED